MMLSNKVRFTVLSFFFAFSIIFSKFYWGYFLTKPSPFSEIEEIQSINGLSYLYFSNGEYENVPNSRVKKEKVSDFPNPLVPILKRVVQERDVEEIQRSKILSLHNFILKKKLLLIGERPYNKDVVYGKIVRIQNNQTLYYLSLTNGQYSNDHYPYYDILIKEVGDNFQLLKKQVYFEDFAGIEGLKWHVVFITLASLWLVIETLIFIVKQFFIPFLKIRIKDQSI